MKRSFTYSHRERSNAPPKREKYLRIWKILSPVPTGKSKIIGCFWKFFVLQKTPSLIWTKGAEMHTHFRAFSRKFFEKKFYPSLIWNYKAKWHPISQKKWENIFSVAGALFCLPKKVPSLIPTENGQMHPLISKKFIPSLIWNWEVETHPVFTKNLKNILCSVVGQLIFACLKSPFTYLELECQNATCFREKFLKKTKKFARRKWRARNFSFSLFEYQRKNF